MTSSIPSQIVQRYFAAWTKGDLASARPLLHDDLSFRGPLDTFDNADDYSTAIMQLAQIVAGIEQRRVFVDGQDVCIIYDLITNTPAGTAPVAEWYHVRGDRIDAIRVFFDARPFAALRPG